MFTFLFIIASFIYIMILGLLFWGTKRLKIFLRSNVLPSVSLIVPMRNEEKNVKDCVHSLVKQDYPKNLLEIIIVDDNSEDKTGDLLEQLASQFPNLKIIHRREKPGQGNKKAALKRAIAESSGEILLFTDADCRPSEKWVRATIGFFDAETGMVIGFSPWLGNNSLLHKIMHTDSLAAGFVSAGTTGLNAPVTCTGRNIAYRRAVFDEVNGFTTIEKSVSGDDDLFLQIVRKKTNWKIRYANIPESVVLSRHNFKWRDFLKQKQRHLSAGKFYSPVSQLGYGVFHISNLFLWTAPLIAFFFRENIFLPLVLLMTKILADRLAIARVEKLFNQNISDTGFLGWELIFLFYNTFLAPLSWVGKIKWK